MIREKMMIRKTDTRLRAAVWAVAVSLALALFALTGTLISARADQPPVVMTNGAEESLKGTYYVGDAFTLPSGVLIEEGGKTYEATATLRAPNGNGTTAASVTLSQAGLYAVEYRAEGEGGALLTAKQTFACYERLFSVSSPKSAASYVESKPLQNGVTGAAGIELSLAKGDTFTFNQVVDLSAAAAAEPFISFYVTPQTLYNYDIARINVILTDPFDPDNRVTVAVKRVLLNDDKYMYRYSYVTASAAGQPETGLEEGSSSKYETVQYDGKSYILHADDAYGTPCYHSMYGGWDEMPNEGMLGKELRLSYDAGTNRFYTWDVGEASSPRLIADLDDPALFDEPWGGFTSGKAIVSVEMTSYRALTGNIVLTSVGGADLTAEIASDGAGPVVSVDLAGYEADDLPAARLGGAYPLFAAAAADESDGSVPVYPSVWYNYASETTRTRVTVADNTFIPEIPGTYTLVYSAADRAGNVTDLTFDVTAEAVDPLAVVYTKADAAAAGEVYTLSNVSLSGGSGKKELTVTAARAGESAQEMTGDGAGNYSFVPLYEGAYTITVAYSDFLESKSESFDLTVAEAAGAYIGGDPVLPRYLISGAVYELPALYGTVFDGGPKTARCAAAVTGGTIEGDTFKVTATEGSVTLTYTLDQPGGAQAKKTYTVPVVAGTGLGQENALDMSKFFVESNYDAGHNSYDRKPAALSFDGEGYRASLIASVTNDHADQMAYGAFDFVNRVLASSLQAEFAISSPNFMRFVVYVTDSADPARQVKLTFSNGGGWKTTFSVNDGYAYPTSYNGASTMSVSYDDAAKAFVTDGSVRAPAASYLSGEPFEGFPSGYAYLTFRIEGVYKAASGSQTGAVRLVGINNQALSGAKSDNFAPDVTAYRSKGDLALGAVTEIPAFFACDVLDPYVTLSVRVSSPSGKTVVSTSGVTLDGTQDHSVAYEIELTEYGSYSIEVTGTAGVTTEAPAATYGIKVVDMSPPSVTFTDAVTSAKVGDTVPFAAVTVSDDRTAADQIAVRIFLRTPSGKFIEVQRNKDGTYAYGSFVPAEAGEYKFVVYACDEGNLYGSATVPNTAIVSYAITVTD